MVAGLFPSARSCVRYDAMSGFMGLRLTDRSRVVSKRLQVLTMVLVLRGVMVMASPGSLRRRAASTRPNAVRYGGPCDAIACRARPATTADSSASVATRRGVHARPELTGAP